jgi:hypothetical protein
MIIFDEAAVTESNAYLLIYQQVTFQSVGGFVAIPI